MIGLDNVRGIYNRERLLRGLKGLVMPLALCIDYLLPIALFIIWKVPDVYCYVIFVVISVISGALIKDTKRGIIYTCICLVVAVTLFIGILITPLIIHGKSIIWIEAVVEQTLPTIVRRMIVVLPLSIVSVLIGCLTRESIE